MASEATYSMAASQGALNEAAFPPLPSTAALLHQPQSLLQSQLHQHHQQAPIQQLPAQMLHPPQPGHIILSNIPADISTREAHAVFLLVHDEVDSVEVSDDHKVHAWFKNATSAAAAARALDGRAIFGPSSASVRADYDGPPVGAAASGVGLSSMLGSLRLSNSGLPLSIQTGQTPQLFGSDSTPASASGSGFDAFPKRTSVGNQRSRFLFSDPFTAGAPSSAPGGQAPSIDLSDITGKSLLLMESQSDAREYDNLVRDPWLSTVTNLPASLAPQTPGISSSLDWGSNPQSSDRRRTSSAFFSGSNNTSVHPNLANGVMPMMQGLSSNYMENPSHGQPQSLPQNHSSLAAPPGQQPGLGQSAASSSSQASTPASQPQRQPPAPALAATGTSSAQQQAPAQQPQPSQTLPSEGPQTLSLAGRKDVPELSLLARVPPPANPADQNPPCNTLYVGNLPPDATEGELRALFLPQKGFRRLSFRTKNLSSGGPSSGASHNHGPMCFVEFEDVAHATRALAELYGRALPRPNGSNGKGGIRLSFSKNPLGVRGPGNPRRSSANQVPGSATPSSGTNGSYGYLYQK